MVDNSMKERVIFSDELKQFCKLSRSTIWRLEKKGLFPKRRQVSPGRVGWLSSEIDAFLLNLPFSEKGNSEERIEAFK